jgi:hypothetical protein
MPKKKLIARRTDKIVASSFSNASDYHESLNVTQERALKTKMTVLNVDSWSAMPPCRGRVLSQEDSFT